MDILNGSKELSKFTATLIAEGERSFFKFISEEQEACRIKNEISASVVNYMLTTKLRDMINDKQLIKMIPSLPKMLECIVEILINGMGNTLS